MRKLQEKLRKRTQRKNHIRKKVYGTKIRPRMSVFKSNKHMYVQVIDDEAGHTIASASTIEPENKELGLCVEDGEKLGTIIGERLKEQGVKEIVFDRNGFHYHGIIKAVAEGARKSGIKF